MDKTDQIKSLLTEHLGVDLEDIKDDDSFVEDLHMGPAELTDFIENLNQIGVDTTKLDMGAIETVGELLEALQLYE